MARERSPSRQKPGRPSTVEGHPNRAEIELARAAGISLDRLAARFDLSRSAIDRYWKGLSDEYKASLVADVPREELVRRATEESGSLLDHMRLARNILERQLIAAHVVGDGYLAANLGRACQEANRDLGRLTGEIQRAVPGISITNTVNNIALMETPQWRELSAGLIAIARDHPDAKDDILGLIRRMKTIPDVPPMIEGRADAA